MYYFPNLDDTTRLNMISELEQDLQNGLFYIPVSIKPDFVPTYKKFLRKTFERGTVESLQQELSQNFFKDKDKNGRKIPSNIREMVTFSDFNRYYSRAILVRAIDEEKSVKIYRAKNSVYERQESKQQINRSFSTLSTLKYLLHTLRDYRILFSGKTELDYMKPNSGLSLMLM